MPLISTSTVLADQAAVRRYEGPWRSFDSGFDSQLGFAVHRHCAWIALGTLIRRLVGIAADNSVKLNWLTLQAPESRLAGGDRNRLTLSGIARGLGELSERCEWFVLEPNGHPATRLGWQIESAHTGGSKSIGLSVIDRSLRAGRPLARCGVDYRIGFTALRVASGVAPGQAAAIPTSARHDRDCVICTGPIRCICSCGSPACPIICYPTGSRRLKPSTTSILTAGCTWGGRRPSSADAGAASPRSCARRTAPAELHFLGAAVWRNGIQRCSAWLCPERDDWCETDALRVVDLITWHCHASP